MSFVSGIRNFTNMRNSTYYYNYFTNLKVTLAPSGRVSNRVEEGVQTNNFLYETDLLRCGSLD